MDEMKPKRNGVAIPENETIFSLPSIRPTPGANGNGNTIVGPEGLSGFPGFRPAAHNHKPGDEPEIILPPPTNIMVPSEAFALTDEELEILAQLEEKERIVRARIRAIALPSYTGVRGFFLYGDREHSGVVGGN